MAEKKTKKGEERVAEEQAVEEAAAETPVEAEAAPDPVAEEEPAAEAEEPAADVPAEAAEEAPATEAEDAEALAEEAAPQPAAEVKKKRKRLPRTERRQRPKVRREKPAERKPITRLPTPESERGRRQERRGVVVSSAMDKTIIVKVDTIKAHTRYKKVVRRSVKFHAHDEQNQANVGDVVRIVETRPLSKTKNWRLVEIVEAAK
jgi:small subunit ribosomal protein S17